MSYLEITEYRVMPETAFKIIRNCPGCTEKTHYRSTGSFRVNANGKRVDIWLIYQCEKCRHTYNLSLYERTNAADIPPGEYEKFQANDVGQAFYYGTDKGVFRRNRAEIAWEVIPYRLESVSGSEKTGRRVYVDNPRALKVREDKIAAEILGISRNQVKELIRDERLEILKESSGFSINFLNSLDR